MYRVKKLLLIFKIIGKKEEKLKMHFNKNKEKTRIYLQDTCVLIG